MTARTIMVQGTASSVGKSIVATALCRLFVQQGFKVAPFKAQNMALNAYVTPDGGEIGRAQAVQAAAARVVPTVDMNPILLKPEGESRSQVVVLGRPIGSLGAVDYQAQKPELRGIVRASLDRLRAAHDIVVIEGAGSPAEVNLKERDIVNMFVAEAADAPVILVGDIDRGGVFAAFVGTLELLEPHERARVKALLINKFRGDVRLLDSGLRFLEDRTRCPILGVVPYVRGMAIADEDSIALEDRRGRRRARPDEVEIAVVLLPRISNYDDFLPLERLPGVVVRFVESAREMEGADLVVLPGTKSTIADLHWLRDAGFAAGLVARAHRGEPVLGICGGCQMLGGRIADPEGVESDVRDAEGVGLLPLTTHFGRDKRTAQVTAHAVTPSFLARPSAGALSGYQIHMGRTERTEGASASFAIGLSSGEPTKEMDGAISATGVVVGTMIHGLFDNAPVCEGLIDDLRIRRGLLPASAAHPGEDRAPVHDEYDRLAQVLEQSIDLPLLRRLVNGEQC
jgi:adenosylcobyric acid synthase